MARLANETCLYITTFLSICAHPNHGWMLESNPFFIPQENPLLTPLPCVQVSPVARSWLPIIQRFLPHSWVNMALQTDKASKRDDVGVLTNLWDRQCLLILPHVTPALDTLHKLLMQVTVLHLWVEFQTYLNKVHEED